MRSNLTATNSPHVYRQGPGHRGPTGREHSRGRVWVCLRGLSCSILPISVDDEMLK